MLTYPNLGVYAALDQLEVLHQVVAVAMKTHLEDSHLLFTDLSIER